MKQLLLVVPTQSNPTLSRYLRDDKRIKRRPADAAAFQSVYRVYRQEDAELLPKLEAPPLL